MAFAFADLSGARTARRKPEINESLSPLELLRTPATHTLTWRFWAT